MLGDVLFISLTEGESWIESRKDLVEGFIGGSGLAVNLLHELCPEGVDPFSPESPVILAPGPLVGLYPACSKTVAMFKSPITGNLGESHAGGRLGAAVRYAGYDAVVILGASSEPVWLDIYDGGKVEVKGASSVSGMSALETIAHLRRFSSEGLQSVAAIGPAGERFIYYANVVVDGYNFFGRLGLGAVMGAKNLKALRVTGLGVVEVGDLDRYKSLFERVYLKAVKGGKMRKYHDLGTLQNVLTLNRIKALPTRNFRSGWFEQAESISGEHLAEKLLVRKHTCPLCPIGCKHVAILRGFFADEHEVEASEVGYDYEPNGFALGSNLGIGDPVGVLRLRRLCDWYGLDAVMVGTMLAWATEAYEHGLVGLEETLVKPRWGDASGYAEMIRLIVETPNRFYLSMAQGRAYRGLGEEFLMTIGGNGLAGYHTGLAFIVGTAIGARHSHLSNAGYSLDQRHIGGKLKPAEVVETLIEEESWRCVLESCGVCLFARRVYDPTLVSEILSSLGFSHGVEDLKRLGRQVLGLKYRFKFREGFSFRKLKIPTRLYETPSANGEIQPDEVGEALKVAEQMLSTMAEKALIHQEAGYIP